MFIFNTKLNKSSNVDTIKSFSVKDDAMWLDNAIFKKLGSGSLSKPGKLNKDFFSIGSKANHAGIAHRVVAIKEEVERLREQVENVE